ncbi:MAG TPA: iron ABC transporter permease [Candidatus Lachnoclostridium avicola]|nr:iron ABC transporter permease [Candidatus Lachnoclostridium avicola]
MKLRENIAGSLILAILTILVLLPLLTVLIQVVCPGLSLEELNLGNLNLVLDVFVRPLWRRAFINSASMSLCTTIAGLILAGFLAQIRVKYNFPLAKLLDIVSWILMIMPSFILAQGWVFFASGNGIARSWLHIEGMNNFLFSFPGLVTVMVLCKYPMAYVAIKSALEWYPARLVHAARLNGASPFKAWTSVQLPLCMPAYFSAAMLIFMDTVGDYGMSSTITAVYSFPTLPYTIYSAICSSPVRFDMAGVLSLYLVVMIVIAMILQFYMMGRKRFDYLDSGTEQVVPKKVSRSASALLSAVSGIFSLVALGIPIGSSFIMSFSNSFSIERFAFTLDNYKNVLQPDGALLEGIRNSLSLAAVAAVVGLILGFAVAYTLTYSQFKLKRLIDMLTLVAMAVPGVVLGIGYIFVWNQKWLQPLGLNLYGKPEILILASVASAVPLINRVLVGGMSKVPQELLVASQVQGARLGKRLKTVLLPLLHSSMVSAVLAAFGGSVFNLAITTILYPPNYSTLPVYISDSYNDLNFGYAAAATMVGGAFIIAIMLLLEFILNFGKRSGHADNT